MVYRWGGKIDILPNERNGAKIKVVRNRHHPSVVLVPQNIFLVSDKDLDGNVIIEIIHYIHDHCLNDCYPKIGLPPFISDPPNIRSSECWGSR